MINHLNVYDNIRTPQVKNFTTIAEWFTLIQCSTYSQLIESVRPFGKGHPAYESIKATLPVITYNFTFKVKKSNNNITGGTGLLYIDIDDSLFDIISLDKSKVFAYYKSFGGSGYSILVQVSGLTMSNYESSYTSICNDLALTNVYDKGAKKCTQFNVLSYDPNIFINYDSFVYSSIEIISTPSVVIEKKKKTYTTDGGELSTLPQKSIRYNNLDEIEVKGNYTHNWDGWDYVNCFLPINKISNGKRNNTLLSYTNNLVLLNPQLTISGTESILHNVNKTICLEPVTTSQIKRIVASVFKYKEAGTLHPIYNTKKRKIIFSKDSGLTSDEKLAVCRKLLSEKRTDDSINKLYTIIEEWDFATYGKIGQTIIHKNFPISKKTVEKYWSEFKEYVSQLNKDYTSNATPGIYMTAGHISPIQQIDTTATSENEHLREALYTTEEQLIAEVNELLSEPLNELVSDNDECVTIQNISSEDEAFLKFKKAYLEAKANNIYESAIN